MNIPLSLSSAFWIGFYVGPIAWILWHVILWYLGAKCRPTWQYAQNHRNQLQELSICRHSYGQLNSDPALKSIRLIELLPAERDCSTIRIHLRTASLNDENRERYEAISYCWGDLKDTMPVFCMGENPIWVTRSLWIALRRIRLKDRIRLLWADAICINQKDNDEKAWQVAMMTDIYKSADQVLIWLGEKADESHLLASFIPRLLHAKSLKDAARDQRDLYELRKEDYDAYRLPTKLDRRYLAFLRLLNRPWFRRVWIIQELALAKTALVQCGEWSISWKSFYSAWTFIASIAGAMAPFFVGHATSSSLSALGVTVAQMSRGSWQPLLQLLYRHRPALATNPRDKIFALAGIASENGESDIGIVINYKVAVSKVYKEAASKMIRNNENLDILSHIANYTGIGDPDLPSWVPDWRTGGPSCPLVAPVTDFNATLNSTTMPLFSFDESRIGLRGYQLDFVAIAGSLSRSTATRTLTIPYALWRHLDSLQDLDEWDRICDAHSNKIYSTTGEAMLDVFWQTLLVGSYDIRFEQKKHQFAAFDRNYRLLRFVNDLPMPRRWWPFKILYGLMVYSILSFDNVISIFSGLGTGATFPERKEFANELLPIMGRKMIRTSRGFVGLATGEAKEGDVVMLLEGGKVPYVLRKTDEENVYHFVGDCYLHGQMHGREWNIGRCQFMWLL